MYHSTSAVTANVCKLALTTQFNTSNGSSGTSCPSPSIYMVVVCTYCPSIYLVVGEEFTAQTAFPSAALIKVPRQKERWQKSVSQQHLVGAVMHGGPLCYILYEHRTNQQELLKVKPVLPKSAQVHLHKLNLCLWPRYRCAPSLSGVAAMMGDDSEPAVLVTPLGKGCSGTFFNIICFSFCEERHKSIDSTS